MDQATLTKMRLNEDSLSRRLSGRAAPPQAITTVTSVDQYNKLIRSPALTVALFSADWAEQCQEILAVMTELAKQFSAVQFVDVPAEELKHQIDAVPTVPLEDRLMALINRANDTFDILTDEEVRQDLKTYSDWPIYPHVYVKGVLVGRLDIIKELLAGGELKETLTVPLAFHESCRTITKVLFSAKRKTTLIVWKLTRDDASDGIPQKRLYDHSHFISDVELFSDGNYALSGSWDKTLRLWDLAVGKSTRCFEYHTKDVLSVAFSVDNRQIVSGSRDRTIKLWNTLAECKYTIQEDGHSDWVSCVRFSPNHSKLIKIWNLANCKLKIDHLGHNGYLNSVSPTVPCARPAARNARRSCAI
ncbi:hypothetical protein pipiens_011138 [Culex pipiens pipiens]|uniref:Small ribosomal subunit protein RACK1 n=1 Tax=Culex pipiens pipiens TaxID=38569 RepID=A0ABD1D7K3_CULPP